jgi:excisionase family DNA binding protein
MTIVLTSPHPRTSREQEIRDVVRRRQPLPFIGANWLLAELDAARLRLAAVELEIEELRTSGVVLRADGTPPENAEISGGRPEWLTVAEFAEAVGISRGLTYDLVRRGALQPVRRFGRLLRLHRDALQVVDKRI